MKRLSHSAIFWRVTAVALIMTVLSAASAPWPALGGSNRTTVAVTQFSNDGGAPPSTVDALSQALYQAVASSSNFSAGGSGPLKVTPAINGDPLTASLNAGAKAGAQEVILGDIIKADSGTIVYRLTAYRINPVGFIRSQVFSLNNASGAAMSSALASNLETIHAPRTAVGTIFSTTNGVFSDLGESGGFQVGQRFNVMHNGSKMAEARIVSINLTQAMLAISNGAAGYSPTVGDRLIGIEAMPAIAPALRANPNTFSLWALVAAAGLTLLAIGHHGQPGNPLPIPSTSPTSSAGPFTLVSGLGGRNGANGSFTFVFSQPVNITNINFSTTTFVDYSSQNPTTPTSPVLNLGGPPPTWNSPTNTQLTIFATNTLQPGESITFDFTSQIQDTNGDFLSPGGLTFSLSSERHPASLGGPAVPPNGGVLVPQLPGQHPTAPHDPRDPHGPKGPK